MNQIISQMLAGGSGKPSAMRAAMLYAVFVAFTVWGYVSIRTAALPDFPEYVALTVIGLSCSKVWQRGKEKQKSAEGAEKQI